MFLFGIVTANIARYSVFQKLAAETLGAVPKLMIITLSRGKCQGPAH